MPTPGTAASLPSVPSFYFPEEEERPHTDALGSTYIPMDSPIYPMVMRLYSLGYADDLYLSLRPWTRRSLLHALDKSEPDIMADSNDQAVEILARLKTLLQAEIAPKGEERGRVGGVESVYTRLMGIHGTPLRDSYHIGQTLINDYGRPYQQGFNNETGFTSVNEWGRFSLYVRGEYQHAPSAVGYNQTLSAYLSGVDQIPYVAPYQLHQDTIPTGPIATTNTFRLQEITASYHLLGHEISFGKSDAWFGPGVGGAMAWSNNAEDVYAFRINRVEPMHIPYLQRIIGPIRYDFMVGPLQGHSFPNAPWVNQVIIAIQPYKDFEFSIQKTAIWGGHGHICTNNGAGPEYPCTSPITIHTFLKSFFDIGDTTGAEKTSPNDPGARFSSATFSWRLPFLRHDVTLYTDSTTHDDDLPVSAPRRAGWRPGIFLAHLPYAPKFDLRAEATYTDYVTLRSTNGVGAYFETVQRQGYTNKGFIFGDWIGREAKGGQAWLTYHLSAEDFVQVEYLNKKIAKDFIVYGTTQNQFKVEFLKHFRHDIVADGWVQYESWKAPVYSLGGHSDVTAAAQITWYPKLKTIPTLK